MNRGFALAIATLALLAVLSTDAHAARCSDHPNQAAAQRAKDTIDLDRDGVYCERLPCPCARPGVPGRPTEPGAVPGGGSRPQSGAGPRRPIVLRAVIVRVIDGDTVRVRTAAGAIRSVRLLGIDTPERGQCGHVAAANHLRRFSPPGSTVALSTDSSQAAYDSYRRLLAYVRTSRGVLQIAQLRTGWARVLVFGRPFRYTSTFRAAEAGAQTRRAGIWGPCVR